MLASTSILCEIHASPGVGTDLADIVTFCADETALAIAIVHHEEANDEPVLTLHVPADLAVDPNPFFCLACRLACFCPQARVGVLIRAANRFPDSAPDRAHCA